MSSIVPLAVKSCFKIRVPFRKRTLNMSILITNKCRGSGSKHSNVCNSSGSSL
jgi:hypothetical protein